MISKKVDKENLRHLINALINTMNRTLTRINKDIGDFYGENTTILMELEKLNNTEDIKNRLLNIFGDIITSADRQSKDQSSDLTEKMLLFIEYNYMRDISLFDLAEKFNISIDYAGKTFKKHVGENFKEYLNEYRVKKAIEILKMKRDIKIKDLALMVGYTNSNSFIRTIRRYWKSKRVPKRY